MASQEGFKALQDKVQSVLVATTRSANRIAGEDLTFQRTVNPSVGDDLDEQSTRLLKLSTKLLNSAAAACGQDKVPTLDDADDVDMQWRKIVDVLDTVLEKADRSLDEFTGVLKRKDAPAAESTPTAKKPKTGLSYNMRNANIPKPQAAFEHPVDNNSVWKPLLTTKPNATFPLDLSLVTSPSEAGNVKYKHPYETEISQSAIPERVYEHAEPIHYKPVDATKAIWVDTYEGVLEMLTSLRKATEIAIDLEHHDHRSYVGLLSLMQISTRDQDWVVDTLQPWRHKLEVLNEVFTDPSIIKIFHGAYMDIVWLQRDLGLYINGLFDTFFAAEALGYPQRSLAYLLKRFADFDADKKYQMADWRIRPLPEEMFYYARSDTHYLLYIYDMIRNELVKASDRSRPETDVIGHVLQKSRDLSMSRYEGMHFDAETGQGPKGWYNLLLKHPVPLSGAQFAVYRAIWKWRDETAREMDESTGYVLPNATVTDIARHMPPDAKALHSLIPNHSVISKRKVNDIWQIFQTAKAQGVNEPSLFEFLREGSTQAIVRKADVIKVSSTSSAVEDVAQSGKMEKSQLFGDVPVSSKWESKPAAKSETAYVLLPWQRLLQSAGATMLPASTEVEMVDRGAKAQEAAAPVEIAPAPVDEEFTLRAGKKRKAKVEDDTSSSEDSGSEDDDEEDEDSEDKPEEEEEAAEPSEAEEEIAVDDEEARAEKETAGRKAAKAQRKVAKRAARKARARTGGDQGETPSKGPSKKPGSGAATPREVDFDEVEKAEQRRRKKERKAAQEAKRQVKAARKAVQEKEREAAGAAVPFDYGAASSVLHAKRNGDAGGQGRQPKFDPYMKKASEEGPKGARKAPPLHGGRSATFKK